MCRKVLYIDAAQEEREQADQQYWDNYYCVYHRSNTDC
jgi:hypothetical protein